jgi:hypothetical protein
LTVTNGEAVLCLKGLAVLALLARICQLEGKERLLGSIFCSDTPLNRVLCVTLAIVVHLGKAFLLFNLERLRLVVDRHTHWVVVLGGEADFETLHNCGAIWAEDRSLTVLQRLALARSIVHLLPRPRYGILSENDALASRKWIIKVSLIVLQVLHYFSIERRRATLFAPSSLSVFEVIVSLEAARVVVGRFKGLCLLLREVDRLGISFEK